MKSLWTTKYAEITDWLVISFNCCKESLWQNENHRNNINISRIFRSVIMLKLKFFLWRKHKSFIKLLFDQIFSKKCFSDELSS